MSRKIINITGLANTGKNKLSNDLGDIYKCNIINGNIFKMFENFKISMGNENSKQYKQQQQLGYNVFDQLDNKKQLNYHKVIGEQIKENNQTMNIIVGIQSSEFYKLIRGDSKNIKQEWHEECMKKAHDEVWKRINNREELVQFIQDQLKNEEHPPNCIISTFNKEIIQIDFDLQIYKKTLYHIYLTHGMHYTQSQLLRYYPFESCIDSYDFRTIYLTEDSQECYNKLQKNIDHKLEDWMLQETMQFIIDRQPLVLKYLEEDHYMLDRLYKMPIPFGLNTFINLIRNLYINEQRRYQQHHTHQHSYNNQKVILKSIQYYKDRIFQFYQRDSLNFLKLPQFYPIFLDISNKSHQQVLTELKTLIDMPKTTFSLIQKQQDIPNIIKQRKRKIINTLNHTFKSNQDTLLQNQVKFLLSQFHLIQSLHTFKVAHKDNYQDFLTNNNHNQTTLLNPNNNT